MKDPKINMRKLNPCLRGKYEGKNNPSPINISPNRTSYFASHPKVSAVGVLNESHFVRQDLIVK